MEPDPTASELVAKAIRDATEEFDDCLDDEDECFDKVIHLQHSIDGIVLSVVASPAVLARTAATALADAGLLVSPQILAELESLRAQVKRLQLLRDYGPSGHCRGCGRKADEHLMSCRLYVGPLEHRWIRTGVNGTFGGVDHYCTCGGWFRQGGLAGHGDGTNDAEPVCPNVEQAHRAAVDALEVQQDGETT